jgi:hypothetical protein
MEIGKPVSIRAAAAALTGPWQPRDLVLANDAAARPGRWPSSIPRAGCREPNPRRRASRPLARHAGHRPGFGGQLP